MNNHDEIENIVLKILSGCTSKKINKSSRLFHDLRIYGDDIGEIYDAIEQELDIQIDFEGAKFCPYFYCEGSIDDLMAVLEFWGWKKSNKIPFTVQDLINIVIAQKWIDPIGKRSG